MLRLSPPAEPLACGQIEAEVSSLHRKEKADERHKDSSHKETEPSRQHYKGLGVGIVREPSVYEQEIFTGTRQVEILVAVEVENDSEEGSHEDADGGNQEQHKEQVVVQADTVVNPRAVVIEALNADITNTAMARAVGAHYLTVWAQEHWIKDLHH